MGRNMFGGGHGPWVDDPWNGWWGEDPPFHLPVFVLTHHSAGAASSSRAALPYFVTDGSVAALELARAAADGKDIALGGGAGVAKQYLAAGLIDELRSAWFRSCSATAIACSTRGSPQGELEQVRAIEAPGVAARHVSPATNEGVAGPETN